MFFDEVDEDGRVHPYRAAANTEAGVPKHVQEALKAKWDQFTGEELQVKFLWIPKKTL